jgi:hypothetical protein
MTTENPVDVPEVTDALTPEEVVETPVTEGVQSKPTVLTDSSDPSQTVQVTVLGVSYSPVDTFAATSAAVRATFEAHQEAIASAQDSAQKWMEQALEAQQAAMKAAQEAVERAIAAVHIPVFKSSED